MLYYLIFLLIKTEEEIDIVAKIRNLKKITSELVLLAQLVFNGKVVNRA